MSQFLEACLTGIIEEVWVKVVDSYSIFRGGAFLHDISHYFSPSAVERAKLCRKWIFTVSTKQQQINSSVDDLGMPSLLLLLSFWVKMHVILHSDSARGLLVMYFTFPASSKAHVEVWIDECKVCSCWGDLSGINPCWCTVNYIVDRVKSSVRWRSHSPKLYWGG